jgi:LemA protein
MARRFYNGAVRELNTAVESFPSNLIAGLFSIVRQSYFEIEISDRATPNVNLGKP